MRPAILLPLAALAACTMGGRDGPIPSDPDGDAVLSEALAGRIEGEPRNCVRQQDILDTRSAGGNTLLFEAKGGLVYVNRAGGSCPRIQPWHAIRHRAINTSICSGELIRVFDPQSGIEFGGCSLGEFVPWRRTG
ncbi:MAG TPA: hypothetical protein VF577_06125 [Allosphingosinicella sp.]|jgi:hypothetical protein